jgi:hypothetical protein
MVVLPAWWLFQHDGSSSMVVLSAFWFFHQHGSAKFTVLTIIFLQPSGSISHVEIYIVESFVSLFGSLARFFLPCGSFGSSNILCWNFRTIYGG